MTDRSDHDDIAWKALLRANTAAPPVDDVDWPALHTRITTGAGPLLRRTATTWWQLLGGRSFSKGHTTAAAAAVITLIVAGALMPDRPAAHAGTGEFPFIEEELAASLAYASVPLLAADADNDDVLDALLFYDGEEW